MLNKQIIENALNFLCEEYGLTYKYESIKNGAQYFKYFNNYGCFIYYEWEQFQEKEFSVKYDMSFYVIELPLLFPKEFSAFNQNHKGVKWWFKDKKIDYWNVVAKVIRKEIERTGCLFGIRID